MSNKVNISRGTQYLDAAENRLPADPRPAEIYALLAIAAETRRLAYATEDLKELLADFRLDIGEVLHKDGEGGYYLKVRIDE
jgi:hypothetical protein